MPPRSISQRRPTLQLENLESRRVLAPVLPDLFAWESESRGYLHDYVIEGDLLRFSTALANKGEGPLEIRGGDVLPNDRQEVYQRIFEDDGSYNDTLAGEFTYHPGHGHIHFDGYAIYNLREQLPDGEVGRILATGGKVSFCLIDIARYDPNAGPSSYGSCGATRQGISAGWSDVYSRGLSDQWINIATIEDGDYFLEVVVDPDDQLVESDETNNETTIPVTINRGGGTLGDIYESNNSFATAADLSVVSYFNQPGLSIHTSSDTDYFQFTAAADGDFTAQIDFTHALGNINLDVYDADRNLIGSSATDSDVEVVTWPVMQGESYYLRASGFDGDTNGYDLVLDGPGEIVTQLVPSDDADLPAVIPDSDSSNTSGEVFTSTLTGPDLVLSDLNLVLSDLRHTYLGDLHVELTSPSGTTATILRSTFENPSGFLGGQDNFENTVIDDQAPNFLGNGGAPFTGVFNVDHVSVGDNPLAVFNGETASGTWTLSVSDWYPSDQGSVHDWGIQFTGSASPDGDRYEPNESFPQAWDLGTLGTAHERELSIHSAQDRDFFRFNSADYGEATVDLLFSHAEGDLELVLYNDQLTEIARSDSSDDDESIVAPVTLGGLYYIEVRGTNGATNGEYALNVSGATGVAGDLNHDGLVDATDVNVLCGALASGSQEPLYDLNSDGTVNADDGRELIVGIMGLLLGDANLDRMVDVSDFNTWNANKFQAGCYTDGDFNFDGVVDTSDFNIWNGNKFTAAASADVRLPLDLTAAAPMVDFGTAPRKEALTTHRSSHDETVGANDERYGQQPARAAHDAATRAPQRSFETSKSVPELEQSWNVADIDRLFARL